MKIKSAVKHNGTLILLAKVSRCDRTSAMRMWGNENSHMLLVGM